jgi:hypothetical protein
MAGITLKIPTEQTLELFIKDEEEARRSKWYQDECTRVKDIPNGWLDVTAKLQESIVKKYGFDDPVSMTIALDRMRRARYIYPDNPVFKMPLYVVNNKANAGTYKDGDDIPDIQLHKRCGQEISFKDLCQPDKSTVVFVGSHT